MAPFQSLVSCLALYLGFICHLTFAQSNSNSSLYPIDPSFFPGANSACLDAYSANVSCPPFIQGLYYSLDADLSNEALNDLCTPSCYSSLAQHRSNVVLACKNAEIYDDSLGIHYLPTTWDDQALYAFNLTCLRRGSSGQYCLNWFHSTSNSSVPGDCDGCNLDSMQVQLNSPFGEDEALTSVFQSLTSSCKSSQYSMVTQTVTYVVNITAPIYQPKCSSDYALKAGDTPLSVSYAFNVSTADLLTINGMNKNSTFPNNGTLCIPPKCGAVHIVTQGDTCDGIARDAGISTAQLMSYNVQIGLCLSLSSVMNQTLCLSNPRGNFAAPSTTANATGIITTEAPKPTDAVDGSNTHCGEWYKVQPGDDCSTITTKFGITRKDFGFLNPEINGNCTNLYLGYSYCVAPVGFITTYPGYYGPTTTSSTPFVGTTATPIPWTDPIWNNNSTAPGTLIPIANGTRADCWQYVFINETTPDLGACGMFALGFSISALDFVNWNPSLGTVSNDSIPANCTLKPSVSYCAQLASPTPAPPSTTGLPNPIAAGSATNCTDWAQASAEMDCASFYETYWLTLAQFYALNPSVNADCTGLYPGTWYCMSTNPRGYNLPPDDDDTTSNPSPTATQPPTSTGSNGIITPTPFQSGMAKNCVKFHAVVQGDGCWDIANDNHIALDDFYAWNPAVGTECTGLLSGFYVCVGISDSATPTAPPSTTTTVVSTPTPTQSGMAAGCNKFYQAVSGDSCDAIAQKYSISLQTFVQWNPAVKSDCTNLWIGTYYCVGGPESTTTTGTPTSTSGVTTPTPTQSGMASGCNKFYLAVSGDSCDAIAQKYSISFQTFVQWNPAVKSDCTNLWVGTYYCVGGPAGATTTSSPPSQTSSTGVTTPTPTQSGMASGCNKFYQAVSGDSCDAISKKFLISFQTFFKWNPAVKSDCTNLWLGTYYCVGGPPAK